jgi:hypothetical protein
MARNDFDPAAVKPDGRPAAHARLFDPTEKGTEVVNFSPARD